MFCTQGVRGSNPLVSTEENWRLSRRFANPPAPGDSTPSHQYGRTTANLCGGPGLDVNSHQNVEELLLFFDSTSWKRK